MNFFKRATTSILRRPGKSIILLLLVFILGSVIAGAISVEGAISNTDANLRRSMQPLVTVGLDQTAWLEWIQDQDFDWQTTFPPSAPQLTPDEIRRMGALPYVAHYDFIINHAMQSFDVTLPEYDGRQHGWLEEGMPAQVPLRGTSEREILHVQQGTIVMTSGRQFETHELQPSADPVAAVVSQQFATENNLSLNSTFTMNQWVAFPDEWGGDVTPWSPDEFLEENIFERIETEFVVVGMFDLPPRIDPDDNEETFSRLSRLVTVYVPNWAIEDSARRHNDAVGRVFEYVGEEMPTWMAADRPEEGEELQMRVVPIFVLEDPADLDNFKEAARPILSSEFLTFEDRSGAFDDIASSMETMQNIANWVLYVSIGATLLILSLLITLFLRDRRYEMGVYLALGEKKGRIITQILMEVLVTSFVAITMSVFIGNLISGAVSHSMLMNELTNETSAPQDNWSMGIGQGSNFDEIGIPTNDMSIEEMMAQFDVSLTIQTIGIFYAIGLGAVVLSTLGPVLYVITLNPKKVLM